MICLGASKIVMSSASELGPIDPQASIKEEGGIKTFSLHNIVNSYEKLFDSAVAADGRMEPFLQQLSRYDTRDIEEFRSQIKLSEDIAIRALQSGMLKGKPKKEIAQKIKTFIDPKETIDHGRAIYIEEAKKTGLKIEHEELRSKKWTKLYELYLRVDNFVSRSHVKCVENKDNSFALALQQMLS